MPILQHLLRDRPTIFDATTKSPIDLAVDPYKFISSAAFFEVQVASDIYWRSNKDLYHINEFGPMKLPYPRVWMEWQIASGSTINGVSLSEAPNGDLKWMEGVRCGALGWELSNGTGFEIMTFMMRLNGQIVAWPVTRRVITDELGSNPKDMMAYDEEAMSLVEAKKVEMITSMMNTPSMMAIGLMNCKNVETVENGRIGMARTSSEKRRKIPARKIKYHTIILPGGGSESDGRGGHRATAIHRVRGHFKTFTAEKPLLGQHVGTYWWGWQVRGKAENGIVVSDYKVGVK